MRNNNSLEQLSFKTHSYVDGQGRMIDLYEITNLDSDNEEFMAAQKENRLVGIAISSGCLREHNGDSFQLMVIDTPIKDWMDLDEINTKLSLSLEYNVVISDEDNGKCYSNAGSGNLNLYRISMSDAGKEVARQITKDLIEIFEELNSNHEREDKGQGKEER